MGHITLFKLHYDFKQDELMLVEQLFIEQFEYAHFAS
jgi:hypothetical protein